jgi:prepilin-type N-terminal cleavage/methylation domain-containing protein/prepilin-type processing-associated H-X9-DG protein
VNKLADRRAFTLLELLVVAGIIGALIAILVPAVQKARESANRTICANNLRQIGLAMQHYEAVNGGLPPNYHEDPSRTDGSHNLFYGPFVRLLPHLELGDTYRNFSFLYYDSPFPDPQGLGWPSVPGAMSWNDHCWQRNPFNRPPVQTASWVAPPDPLSCPNPTGATGIAGQTWGAEGTFKVFLCPSQPFNQNDLANGSVVAFFLQGQPGIDMPKGNPFWDGQASPTCMDNTGTASTAGCTLYANSYPPGNYVIGRSDYVAVVGAFIDGSFTNPPLTPEFAHKYHSLFNYGVNSSLSRVPDGASNTLLLSEFAGKRVVDPIFPEMSGWLSSSWATSGLSVAFGTCPDPNNHASVPGGVCDYGPGGLGSGVALGGWHNGRFQVCFADGSVRSLPLGVDRLLMFRLAGYRDGENVSSADY